jgi:hypothetical protein
MTKLELVTEINHAVIEMRMLADAAQTQLRCPACTLEFALPSSLTLDTRVVCKRCRVTSEFRQFHESWCSSRRPDLRLACPELRWPAADRPFDHGDRRVEARWKVPTFSPFPDLETADRIFPSAP